MKVHRVTRVIPAWHAHGNAGLRETFESFFVASKSTHKVLANALPVRNAAGLVPIADSLSEWHRLFFYGLEERGFKVSEAVTGGVALLLRSTVNVLNSRWWNASGKFQCPIHARPFPGVKFH